MPINTEKVGNENLMSCGREREWWWRKFGNENCINNFVTSKIYMKILRFLSGFKFFISVYTSSYNVTY